MHRFELKGKQYSELIDTAQDAECKGEVVYTSKGGPE